MKRTISAVLVVSLALFVSNAFAHDAYIGWCGSETNTLSPITLDGIGNEFSSLETHDDESEWKGFAFVGTQNTGTEAWTGVNFFIFDAMGYDATSVLFVDSPAQYNPSSPTHQVQSWTLGTNQTGHSTLDVIFDQAVMPGETLLIQVYTDNTD